jgi:hypothetical protein
MKWHPDALARLKRAPFFIRPLVKKRTEAAARKRGLPEVTIQLLDEVKASEHKG